MVFDCLLRASHRGVRGLQEEMKSPPTSSLRARAIRGAHTEATASTTRFKTTAPSARSHCHRRGRDNHSPNFHSVGDTELAGLRYSVDPPRRRCCCRRNGYLPFFDWLERCALAQQRVAALRERITMWRDVVRQAARRQYLEYTVGPSSWPNSRTSYPRGSMLCIPGDIIGMPGAVRPAAFGFSVSRRHMSSAGT